MNQNCSKMNHHRRVRHTAFTLVELLVVITIIGILIAMLIPAAMAAMTSSKNAAMAMEVANIGSSLQAFKTQYQAGFPPDFSALDVNGDNKHLNSVNQTLGRLFRLRDQADDVPYNPWVNDQRAKFHDLDCGEALVFWLMGFSDSSQRPLTGTINAGVTQRPVLFLPSKPDDVAAQMATKFYVPPKTPMFEFDKARLDDRDKDGFPEYYPKYGNQAPYVYYNSGSYQHLYANNSTDPHYLLNLTNSGPGNLRDAREAPRPYLTKAQPIIDPLSGARKLVRKDDFASSDTFQIIAAGLDGLFGIQVERNQPGQGYAFPDGPYPDKAHRDNVTSFAGGTLESKMP